MKRVRPTTFGWKAAAFYGCLLLAFYSAPYANLLYLLLVFLSVLGAVALCSAYATFRGFEDGKVSCDPMPAECGGALQMAGSEKLTVPGLHVEVILDGGKRFLIPARQSGGACEPLLIPALPRGLYPIKEANLVSEWPLGVFAARRALAAPQALVVYPQPESSASRPSTRGGRGEDLVDGLGDQEFLTSSLREYHEGDEVRRIHWKATARRHMPVVKEFEDRAAVGSECVLDLRQRPEDLEHALSSLTKLALGLRETKGSLLLHTQHGSVQYGAQGAPWSDLLVFLAGVSALPEGAGPVARVGRGVRHIRGGSPR